MNSRPRVPRALVLILALAFLFETWIWDNVVAAVRRLATLIPWATLKAALARGIDRLPVWASLLLFGIPLLVSEGGSFFCVLWMAMGHVVGGMVGYAAIKLTGFGLLAAIFDLTRPKLMALPWFAYLYDKALAFHHFAQGLIAPYRAVAKTVVTDLRGRARAFWAKRVRPTETEEEAG